MSVDVFSGFYRCPREFSQAVPFDLDEIVENLRFERYSNAAKGNSASGRIARKVYYALRPLLGVGLRKHLQRRYLKGWDQIAFPHWPVDRTVECIFESVAMLTMERLAQTQMSFVWFWPADASGCVILTHDIETAAGRDFAPKLADIDASFGFKSSFQIVPEERYEVTPSFLDDLRSRGCEINIHGLNHDGRLFEDHATFTKRAAKINSYARRFGAFGFRSPVLYRNFDWYGELEFSYDMSVPNCAHLDPQRGGCCTVMPYFVGDVLELPLTMTQDYSLFHYLKEESIELWKEQIDLVLEKHGLISFNIHPDYIADEPYRSLYSRLLEYLAEVCVSRNVWAALPGEVDQWWRQRLRSSAFNSHAFVEEGRLRYAVRSMEWETPVLQAA